MVWRLRALSDDIDETGETAVFLDAAQRKAVIAAASSAAARFLRGLELTDARPKELAATLVVDFDGYTLRLAHRKGRPAKPRRRHVVLSAEAVEFFREQSKDKLPSAPLFTEDGETPWRRHVWAREVIVRAKANAIGDPNLMNLANLLKTEYMDKGKLGQGQAWQSHGAGILHLPESQLCKPEPSTKLIYMQSMAGQKRLITMGEYELLRLCH